MEIAKSILFIVIIIWCLLYIFFMIYLYLNDSRMYDLEYDVDTSNIDRTPEDLSLIIYKKIKIETFTASIIKLINDHIITIKKENDDFVLIKNNEDNLSKSQFTLVDFLFNTIGNEKEVSLKQINSFGNKKSGCSMFLMIYDIWKKMIIVESKRKEIFEPKLEYNIVKLFQRTGILLFALNILLKKYCLIGFFIIIPSIFISLYFYKISKLTKEYTQEYYGWLQFRKQLKENNIPLNKNKYLEYTVILRCIEIITPNERREFIEKLDNIMRKCYTNAVLNGNRSLFK